MFRAVLETIGSKLTVPLLRREEFRSGSDPGIPGMVDPSACPIIFGTMIETLRSGDQLLAVILSHRFAEPGIHFFTPNDLSQQLAFMRHPRGKLIEPHVHNAVSREVQYTQEVLFIKRGRLRVDFYDNSQKYLESRILEAGDVILLATGGHGFEVIEEVEMVEVKQGPYAGDQDKTRFTGVTRDQVTIRSSSSE